MVCATDAAQSAHEVWCLAGQHFTASHRAMWHLAHLRCSVSRSNVGDDVFGNNPVRIVHLQSEDGGDTSDGIQEWRITTRTRVSFISTRYHFLFSLDLSPSVSVVDTSFKGFITGTYLFDSLLPCLDDTLRLLLARMSVGQISYEPHIFVTVLAQGSPAFGLQILERSARVTSDNLEELLSTVKARLAVLLDRQAAWLQSKDGQASGSNGYPNVKPQGGRRDGQKESTFGRRRGEAPRAQPPKAAEADGSVWDGACGHNDLNTVLRNCLLALSVCGVSGATPAIVVLTDGVMSSLCNTLQFIGALMHLSALDVSLHIVQIGGGFAPWSALGMCSDLDHLSFLVSSTPGGVIFQDHHISSMLRAAGLSSGTCGQVNGLQRAWLWRGSALSVSPTGHKRANNRGSFLSSLTDRPPDQEDTDEQSYVDHLRELGCTVPPKFVLTGLDDHLDQLPAPAQLQKSRNWMWLAVAPPSPLSRALASKKSSGYCAVSAAPCSTHTELASGPRSPAWEDTELQVEAEHYEVPGNETHGHLYTDSSYRLRLVPLAQLIECRAREGFQLIEHVSHQDDHFEVQFGLTWRPMFMIFYSAEVDACRKQEIRVRIQHRAPSPEYLKHKGVRSTSVGDLGEHQAQLDDFVRALRIVDDILEKVCEVAARVLQWQDLPAVATVLEPRVFHRWFATQRFECTVAGTGLGLRDVRGRLERWASAVVVPDRRYWRTYEWGALWNTLRKHDFQCRCCAPDGMPLLCIPNHSQLASSSGRTLPLSPPNMLPACCLLDISEIDHESVAIVIGTMGLCPHAEHAVLASLQGDVLKDITNSFVGSPQTIASPHGHIFALGQPGVLHGVLQASNPPVPRRPTAETTTGKVTDMLGPITCTAMDGLGALGGSFFTFSPDWSHLKDCVPRWSWRDSFKTGIAAETMQRIVNQLRSREGWLRLRNDEWSCCYVKRLPLMPLGREASPQSWTSRKERPEPVERARQDAAAPQDAAVECSAGSPWSSVGEGAAAAGSPRDVESARPSAESPAVISHASQMLEATLCGIDGQEVVVTAAPDVQVPVERQSMFGSPTPVCCSLYYCMHVETPMKRTKRRDLVTTIWLDAPAGGMFDPRAQSTVEVQGPFCRGVNIAAGSRIRLEWEPCHSCYKVRAMATALFPTWPPVVEIRFLCQHSVAAVIVCKGDGEAAEAQLSQSRLGDAITRVEVSALGGPAILVGIWVETCPQGQQVAAHDLGDIVAREVAARDALVAAGVSFAEHTGNIEELRRTEAIPRRAHSEPDIWRARLPSENAEASGQRLHPEVRGVCGLMRSIQQHRSLSLSHSCLVPWQHHSFLKGLERIEHIHRRVDCDGEADSDYPHVERGHYFFSFHSSTGTALATSFSVVFVPAEQLPALGPLKVYVGDGCLESLHLLAVRNSLLEMVLSPNASERPSTDDRRDVDLRSKRSSKDLAARVEEVHLQTCAHAVHYQLQIGCDTLTHLEINAALEACSRATATLDVGEFSSVSQVAGVHDIEALCTYLDACLVKSCSAHGFHRRRQGDTLDTHGVTWFFHCYSAELHELQEPKPTSTVLFLQVKLAFEAADAEQGGKAGAVSPEEKEHATARDAMAEGQPGTEAETKSLHSHMVSSLVPSLDSGTFFQTSFAAGRITHLQVLAHYLPREVTSGSHVRAWRASAPRKHHNHHNMRWDGWAAFHGWDSEVADRVMQIGEGLAASIYVAHADLLLSARLTRAWEVQTVQRLFARLSEWPLPVGASTVHLHRIQLPLARSANRAKALKMLVAELLEVPRISSETPETRILARLCQVADAPLDTLVFVWPAPPLLKTSPGSERKTKVFAPNWWLDAAGCDAFTRKRQQACQALGSAMAAASIAPSAPPLGPSPFWIYITLHGAHDSSRTLVANLHVLFTPRFWNDCLASHGEPPGPDPYVAICDYTLRVAATRMNQKLLLEQIITEGKLSELLHPELRANSSVGSICDDLSPFAFLAKQSKADQDGRPELKPSTSASPSREGKSPSPVSLNTVKQTHRTSRNAYRNSNFGSAEIQSDEPAVEPEDPQFVRLLASPDALECPLQGTVRIDLVPCLHHFRIINWLGGGEAEEAGKSTSAKVSFQRQKNAQPNEVVSIFAKNCLRSPFSRALWLSCAGSSGEGALPHFVRPRYESEPTGHVALLLDCFGLTPLNAEARRMIKRKVEAQLEKLAIVKLQLHTLDRQETPALRGAVLDFLRPPGTSPGLSVLLGIPHVAQMLSYAQFVRRALLGLLEPSAEVLTKASRTEEFDVGVEDRSGAHHALASRGLSQATMNFVYKRRNVEQVITDVRHYEKRGPQHRDKVSEKVLQFQGCIGDGVAFVQLAFISAQTGKLMEDLADSGQAPLPIEDAGAGAVRSPLHSLHPGARITRRSGRFETLQLNSITGKQAQGGYMLVDMWYRAMDGDHAEKLAQEIQVAADQALREFHLQSHLLRAQLFLQNQAYENAETLCKLIKFQAACLEQLDDMPHQHLSSLYTHNPPDVHMSPPDTETPWRLPPWVFLKTLQGLHELLQAMADSESAADGCKYATVVTLQGATAAPTGCASELFDVESPTCSLSLAQFCQSTTTCTANILSAETFLDCATTEGERSPRFVIMWGPSMAAWKRRLQCLSADAPSAQMKDLGADAEAGSAGFGFVHHVVHNFGLLQKKHRLDQYRVEKGGAAGLKKHTLSEWRETDEYLKSRGLASPYLVISIDSLGAKLRGVCIEPTLMLRVQYFLQSQFMWVWARAQLFKDMCACELRRPVGRLCDAIRREFPWIFHRRGSFKEQSRSSGVVDDHSTVGESVHSALSIDSFDEVPAYLIFGLAPAVVDVMVQSEVVPDPGEFGLLYGVEAARDAILQSCTAASGGQGLTGISSRNKGRMRSALSGGSSLFEAQRSDVQGPTSSCSVSTIVDGAHKGTPGYFPSRPPVAKIAALRSQAAMDNTEASLRHVDEVFWHEGEERVSSPPDVKDVLAGEALLSRAIKAVGGLGSSSVLMLRDPLSFCARRWLDEAERKMRQHRLVTNVTRVIQEWEQQGVPLSSWARRALDNHEAEEHADDRLVSLAEELQQRMFRQGRCVQDPSLCEAELLVLSLIHRYAVPLAHPFSDKLCIGPGLAASGHGVPKFSGTLGRGPLPPPSAHRQPHSDQASIEQVTWRTSSRTCSLSEKLCETTPLLTIRQRFLSSLLDVFTGSPFVSSASDVTQRWKLVLCLEHPLPWQGWDLGQSSTTGVLMRPQTLLLHRSLSEAAHTGVLAAVSCHSDYAVHVEVFTRCAQSVEAMAVAEDVLASIRVFCFDFQLRTLVGSYHPLSLGYMWPVVDALLHGTVKAQESHPDRARNLLVLGELPSRTLAAFLQNTDVPFGMRPHHLVGFMHASAHQYGFECHGEAHSPLFALSGQSHCFVRLVHGHGWKAGVCPARPEGDNPPLAQGLRCVLFACPFSVDRAPHPIVDGGCGAVGFRFAAVLVDSAWCSPSSSSSTEDHAHNVSAWADLAASLRGASMEALTAFAELAATNLAFMRRFNAVWRCPQRAKSHDLDEVLASCRFHVDLFMEPLTSRPLRALCVLPAGEFDKLGGHLKDIFRGQCCDFSGQAVLLSKHARGAAVEHGGKRAHPIVPELPARQLFIVFALGSPVRTLAGDADERHYMCFQLKFQEEAPGALQGVWLHSSRGLRTAALSAGADPSSERRAERPSGGRGYPDELGFQGEKADPAEPASGELRNTEAGYPGEVCGPGAAEGLPWGRDASATGDLRNTTKHSSTTPLRGAPSSLEKAPDVRHLLQRFVAVLVDFAFQRNGG